MLHGGKTYEYQTKSEDPLISIILPTYNREQLLFERAIQSVSGQTWKNLELIVCVHGSTDRSYDRVRDLATQDHRVVPIWVDREAYYPPTAENHWFTGPVDPLNAGLSQVRGEWIARIDDDDVWLMDHLLDLWKYAVWGNYEFVSSAHRTLDGVSHPYRMKDCTRIGGCQTWLYRSYLKFFRYDRNCYKKPWNKVNDTDLQHRMWRAGVRFGYLNRVTTIITPRPGVKKIGLAAYTENREDIERQYSF